MEKRLVNYGAALAGITEIIWRVATRKNTGSGLVA